MTESRQNGAGKWKTVLTQLWVSCFVSFLFLRSTASSFWSEENRFYFHWQKSDAGGIFLAIVLVGFAFFLAFTVFRRFGRPGVWLADLAFVAVTIFYFKVTFAETLEQRLPGVSWTSTVLKATVIICLALFIVRRKQVVNAIKALCLILSPILCIYAAVLISAREYPGNRLETTGAKQVYSGSIKPKKIFFIVFDEWSYDRTFHDGSPMDSFPGLKLFASRSVVFRNVDSPYVLTFLSIPCMLLGTSAVNSHTMDVRGLLDLFERNNTSIFSDMKRAKYRTVIYGNHLPYAALFKEDIDSCRSKGSYKITGGSIPCVAFGLILENIKVRFGGFSESAKRPFYYFRCRFVVEMAAWIHKSLKQEILQQQSSFIFIHYPLPHDPYIFNRSGAKPDLLHIPGIEGYEGNLQFMDSLIEDIVCTINASPWADDAMIVLLSDHSWKKDPALEGQSDIAKKLQRIPLIVHLPGQKDRIDFNDGFSMRQFRSVLAEYLETDLSVDSFMSLCKKKEGADANVK